MALEKLYSVHGFSRLSLEHRKLSIKVTVRGKPEEIHHTFLCESEINSMPALLVAYVEKAGKKLVSFCQMSIRLVWCYWTEN